MNIWSPGADCVWAASAHNLSFRGMSCVKRRRIMRKLPTTRLSRSDSFTEICVQRELSLPHHNVLPVRACPPSHRGSIIIPAALLLRQKRRVFSYQRSPVITQKQKIGFSSHSTALEIGSVIGGGLSTSIICEGEKKTSPSNNTS